MAYVFDSNSFRELGSYYPKQFPSFWIKFNHAVEEKKNIISVREVYREIELYTRHAHITEWIKDHKSIFITPEAIAMRFVSEIFTVQHFKTLVSKKSQLKGIPCADPFIIAVAKIINGCVVTEEEYKEHGARIPNVCEYFNIDCTNLQGFMEREGWKF